jgi:hypothetical protein
MSKDHPKKGQSLLIHSIFPSPTQTSGKIGKITVRRIVLTYLETSQVGKTGSSILDGWRDVLSGPLCVFAPIEQGNTMSTTTIQAQTPSTSRVEAYQGVVSLTEQILTALRKAGLANDDGLLSGYQRQLEVVRGRLEALMESLKTKPTTPVPSATPATTPITVNTSVPPATEQDKPAVAAQTVAAPVSLKPVSFQECVKLGKDKQDELARKVGLDPQGKTFTGQGGRMRLCSAIVDKCKTVEKTVEKKEEKTSPSQPPVPATAPVKPAPVLYVKEGESYRPATKAEVMAALAGMA